MAEAEGEAEAREVNHVAAVGATHDTRAPGTTPRARTNTQPMNHEAPVMTSAADKTARDTSNKITMTLPPLVFASLGAEAAHLDMTPGEFLKHLTIAAYTQAAGIMINLRPAAMPDDV